MPDYRVTERAGMLKHNGKRYRALTIVAMSVSLALPMLKAGLLEETEDPVPNGLGSQELQNVVVKLRTTTKETLDENEELGKANEAHLETIRKLKAELGTAKGQITKLKKAAVAAHQAFVSVESRFTKLKKDNAAVQTGVKRSESQLAKLKKERVEAQEHANVMAADLKVVRDEVDKLKAQLQTKTTEGAK